MKGLVLLLGIVFVGLAARSQVPAAGLSATAVNDSGLAEAMAGLAPEAFSEAGSTWVGGKESRAKRGIYAFKPLQLVVPAIMIGVGVVGLESHWIIRGNHELREELQESGHGKFTIDDFTQFAPAVALYGLNLCGVDAAHNIADRTIIMGTATLLTLTTVYTIKSTGRVQRPDGSAFNSFPSGHTAIAFMGAELLRREYWEVSPWIGVAGYVVAAATGFLRMYNNRHWATDVLAGAGIGILSAEIAYWVFPCLSKLFYPSRREGNGVAIGPFISSEAKGLACRLVF